MSTLSDSAAHVAEQDVRGALAKIVVSPAFRASPQLASFLRFVVEATLSGRGDRIKGYTIAIEALGRNEEFDPQSDPIVRVEAGRLRRALDRYYDGEGKNDAVMIELPRGSYVPTIRRREAVSLPTRTSLNVRTLLAADNIKSASFLVPAILILSIVVHVGIDWLGRPNRPLVPQITAVVNAASAPAQPSRKLNPGPWVVIDPVTSSGKVAAPIALAASLETRLREAFTLYDDVTVVSTPTSAGRDGEAATTRSRPQSIDYRLASSIEYQADGNVSFEFQLVDNSDGSIVWSRSIPPVAIDTHPRIIEAAVVRDVASALLERYGVVYARERKKHATDPKHDPHFGCIIDAAEYFRTYDHARFRSVRHCLENVIAEDPTFASAYTDLAELYGREYMFDLGSNSDTPALDRALDMARRAIELQPNHVRAHYVLLEIHMARGEIAEAMAAGEKAIALNPYDIAAHLRYGTHLVLLGEIYRGLKLVNEANAYLPVTPPRYHVVLAIAAYLKDDLAAANVHASQISTDNSPLGLIARVLVAHLSGDHARLARTASQLVAQQPKWQTEPRQQLEKSFHTPWMLDRISKVLTEAGLGTPSPPLSRALTGTAVPMIYVEPFSQPEARPPGGYDPAWIRL